MEFKKAKKISWWRGLFTVIGVVMAALYLRDAFGESLVISDLIKGCVWVALVILVIVLELLAKTNRKSSAQE